MSKIPSWHGFDQMTSIWKVIRSPCIMDDSTTIQPHAATREPCDSCISLLCGSQIPSRHLPWSYLELQRIPLEHRSQHHYFHSRCRCHYARRNMGEWFMQDSRHTRICGHIYKKQVGKRGQGGVACIMQEHLVDKISFFRDDKHKRFIWLKVEFCDSPLFLAGCFIPHHESPFYAETVLTLVMHLNHYV